ncbi:bifunctional adenosylcobinamide kinase/adenosylcobinamide-phosphate guanylyltransferase [Sulfitobacter noctilucae]|uniref:bifunctional adenosylcobinamide kinase/adenosylcobinamide-phosphate guanylyltransferase n=1 Tax=Sulfitobacter noctilucae TaxID=1342302 RepID=UPI0030C783B7
MPRSSFVLGGAASGKSGWAEELAESFGLPITYIATSQIFDAEMSARVKIHKKRRDDRWTTVEEPLDLASALDKLTAQQVAFIDCATMWLSNHLIAQSDIADVQDALVSALHRCAAPWIIVSNEVGSGIVPDNALARQFREAQGRLNIALAAEAGLAVQVVAGLPVVLKGQLP